MIDILCIVGYRLPVCQNYSGSVGIVSNLILGTVFHRDGCIALIASSVETVVCSCTGYRIKCTFIVLTLSICFIRLLCASCLIYALIFPVLAPGKTCVYVFVGNFFFHKCFNSCIQMLGCLIYGSLALLFL